MNIGELQKQNKYKLINLIKIQEYKLRDYNNKITSLKEQITSLKEQITSLKDYQKILDGSNKDKIIKKLIKLNKLLMEEKNIYVFPNETITLN